ncbi:MAG TPA: cytochrome c biogenesis protein [Candidatus Binatia bacterium]
MSEAVLLRLAMLAYLVGTVSGGLGLVQPRDSTRRTTAGALVVGFVLQAAAIVVRSLEVGTIAVSSFAEQGALFACLLVGIYVLAQLRYRLAVLGAVVGPIGFIGALVALVAHGGAQDVPPFLRSPWLPVHVMLAFLGNAAFALACIVSLLYLWQERQLKAHHVGPLARRLPSLETLDNVNFKFLGWGFILLTLSIVSGVLWAELTSGRLLSWEPRTIWTSVIWVIYAVLLHGRLTVGWGGRRAAALTIVGFAVLFVSFIGVNVLTPGRHAVSYG